MGVISLRSDNSGHVLQLISICCPVVWVLPVLITILLEVQAFLAIDQMRTMHGNGRHTQDYGNDAEKTR